MEFCKEIVGAVVHIIAKNIKPVSIKNALLYWNITVFQN